MQPKTADSNNCGHETSSSDVYALAKLKRLRQETGIGSGRSKSKTDANGD